MLLFQKDGITLGKLTDKHIKLYQDSIQDLKDQSIATEEEIKKNDLEKEEKVFAEQKIKQKNEQDKKARLDWLCSYVNNKEAPTRFIMNIPETRFMKIETTGNFNVKSYDGYHNEKLTSIITGNLKDLNPKSVRTFFSDDGYLFIHINCINTTCINENGKTIHNTVSFGPYWADYITNFPDKLKKAFEEVITDFNGHSEYY